MLSTLTFDTAFHDILIGKLRSCKLYEWMVRWVENWLNDRLQRVVISDRESYRRSVASDSSVTWTKGRVSSLQVC